MKVELRKCLPGCPHPPGENHWGHNRDAPALEPASVRRKTHNLCARAAKFARSMTTYQARGRIHQTLKLRLKGGRRVRGSYPQSAIGTRRCNRSDRFAIHLRALAFCADHAEIRTGLVGRWDKETRRTVPLDREQLAAGIGRCSVAQADRVREDLIAAGLLWCHQTREYENGSYKGNVATLKITVAGWWFLSVGPARAELLERLKAKAAARAAKRAAAEEAPGGRRWARKQAEIAKRSRASWADVLEDAREAMYDYQAAAEDPDPEPGGPP